MLPYRESSETSTSRLKKSANSFDCFIGLGSNLNEPKVQIEKALFSLGALGEVIAVSSLYSSPPMEGGPSSQPDYINAVAKIQTDLGARELFKELKKIEGEQGRVKIEKWGPRIIDLDLLTYGDLKLSESDLEIPHKGIMERVFVLVPLLEVDALWNHPVTKVSGKKALLDLDASEIDKL